jgi:hypothetical protein
MKIDFENPQRYKLDYANPYGDSEEMSMNSSKTGDYVTFDTYSILLKEHLELKHRMDGLDK